MPTSRLASRISAVASRHDNHDPLWRGPCGDGPLGGVTQSMLWRFLDCRERFRLKYVLGLEGPDKWNHRLGYGNMWHACEESLASADGNWLDAVDDHTYEMMRQYPRQQDEILKWYNICRVQFPEYVKHWAEHPDVLNRTPLMQEEVFDVPYTLLSGRTVRLRGKFDSVDIIDGGIYLQENKTKGEVDKLQIEKQLKFDLQTMLYLIALDIETQKLGEAPVVTYPPIRGVRYNVIRRPLSGGKGNIKPHSAKYTKTKTTPAETEEEFYERLRRDYIAAEPDYWFFRVRSEVSARDVQVFRDTCLDPLLETLCWWYEEVTGADCIGVDSKLMYPPMNYRTPFGKTQRMSEETEYDTYLECGSEIGLRRVESLFQELQ